MGSRFTYGIQEKETAENCSGWLAFWTKGCEIVSRGPRNPKSETARGCAVHLKIVHIRIGEEFFDGRLEFPIGNVFVGHKTPPARVGFERPRARAKFLGKASVFRKARAGIRVNIDWARLRKRFDASETIKGKQNSAILSRNESAQAVTARSVVRGDFSVRWNSVFGSAQGLP